MFVIDRSDKDIHHDQVELCDGLFICVDDRFHARFRKPVSVVQEKKLCFNLIWESEFYMINQEMHPYLCNYKGSLLESMETLDYTFLDRYDSYFFDGMNEYAWHIIRVIHAHAPEKNVFVKDEFAVYFKDIPFISVQTDPIPLENERQLKLISGHSLPKEDDTFTVYSAILSLNWCRIRHYNKNYKYDETVLLIDFSNGSIGFGDIIRMVSSFVQLAANRKWIPAIKLNHECQYKDSPDEDSWSKYFMPLNDVDVGRLEEYRCIISIYENLPQLWVTPEPFLFKYYVNNRGFILPVSLNQQTLLQVQKKIPASALTGRVLGVLLRTTDFDWFSKNSVDTNYYISFAKTVFERGRFDHIFLATEDSDVLELFRSAFGDDLLYIEQHRVSYKEIANKTDKGFISEYLGEQYFSKTQLAVDYLSAIYALSLCDMVLYNRFVGALVVAKSFKTGAPLYTADMNKSDPKTAKLPDTDKPESSHLSI